MMIRQDQHTFTHSEKSKWHISTYNFWIKTMNHDLNHIETWCRRYYQQLSEKIGIFQKINEIKQQLDELEDKLNQLFTQIPE